MTRTSYYGRRQINMMKENLQEIIKGKDIFIGVSAPNIVSAEMVSTMAMMLLSCMANPVPEIMPDEAKR